MAKRKPKYIGEPVSGPFPSLKVLARLGKSLYKKAKKPKPKTRKGTRRNPYRMQDKEIYRYIKSRRR